MNNNRSNNFLPMTIGIIVVTSMVTLLQFVYPEILSIMRRNPSALVMGEWWRIITPLLVHADGWWQYIFNIACIAIIGGVVERLYGRIRFLILYLAGGVIGEIAGYVSWDPYGAGASVGLCGLLGGLYVRMIIGNKRVQPFYAILSLYLVVGLVGFASEEIYISIGLFVAVTMLITIIKKQNNRVKLLSIISGIGGLLGGMALLVLNDIHGAAILGGFCTAFIFILTRRPRSLPNEV
ncbi:rhomboid family intramembrane serine protease [Virgibacillus sp. NKC19-3]|uniref:rhomboid family intramembrane serine protease n=1 Tax=Virgibacillus saliphilus TaxID=2831674 RepID=UPI001C9A3C22|nr:rhomboid family intramembrane serine protease [Virgibacillus sp. NKC19-3]MBY7141866.1 rhomboid family intramembrane serine protease [Virgibacillus sp. NKC19-3]